MQNLIERLEKATGPDREIDDAIGAILERPCKNWPFTASIDAAMTLVPEEWKFCLWTENGLVEGYPIKGVKRPAGIMFRVQGHDLPIALCIAALKARAAIAKASASPLTRHDDTNTGSGNMTPHLHTKHRPLWNR